MDSQNIHEIGFIKSFVVKEKQERFLSLIQNKKNRKKLRLLLAHNIVLNEKDNILKKEDYSEERIYMLLKKYGAPSVCHIICESSKYDDTEADLKESLHELYTLDFGYIISCIPGKLAYYQGESPSCRVILLNQLSNV
jgi:hypothetical protein